MIFSRNNVSEQSLLIQPSKIHFLFKANQKIPAQFSIENPTCERIAYKVRTTRPQRYSVRPSFGILEPGQVVQIRIVMQRQAKMDIKNCEDKFQVQFMGVGEDLERVSQEMFCGSRVRDVKLQVVIEAPNTLEVISEFEDYQEPPIAQSRSQKLRKNMSDLTNFRSREFSEIRNGISQAVAGLQNRVKSAKEDENSVYNKSIRVVDSSLRKGASAAGNMWVEFSEIMLKGKQAVSERVSDLKPGEKMEAAKQLGGKIFAGAEKQLIQFSKKAVDLVESNQHLTQ